MKEPQRLTSAEYASRFERVPLANMCEACRSEAINQRDRFAFDPLSQELTGHELETRDVAPFDYRRRFYRGFLRRAVELLEHRDDSGAELLIICLVRRMVRTRPYLLVSILEGT